MPSFSSTCGNTALMRVHHPILMMRQFHQHPRAAMLVVDDAAVRFGGNDFAGAEVGFMFHRKAREFFQFLR